MPVIKPFSSFWLVAWSFGLAVGWLLPNHYVPWIAFHFDVWIASWLALAAGVVVFRTLGPVDFHRLALVCVCLMGVPFFQYWFGLLPFVGQAWLGAAFLMGLLVSLILGAHWESSSPSQAVDGLFLAIGTAAVVSVGLQLYQWFGLSVDALDLWVMGATTARPFANFIQPNQLATFLLWALLACAWGVARGQIGRRVAVFMAMYLLFGIALTQSRTAFVAIVALVVVSYFWRHLWASKAVAWVVAGLAVYYFVCLGVIPIIAGALDTDAGLGMAARSGGELRIPAYKLLVDAAVHSPLWGYGWAQTAEAQLAVAENHPALGGIFMQSHNLFLDLIVWCGIPIGALLSITLTGWFAGKARRVISAENAILVMFVGVVAWHAMLELPLHYAYMLLPTGLVMGVLNCRLAEPVVARGRRWQFGAVLLAAVALLAVITRDYLRIEENFYVLRFERARIGSKPLEPPASVLILNHMNEFVRLGRTRAKIGMTAAELDWMSKAAHAYPSLGNLFTLSLALAWNERADEAQTLVNKLPKITTPIEYSGMRGIWQAQAKTDAMLAAIIWPN
jgi:hypothetical protein